MTCFRREFYSDQVYNKDHSAIMYVSFVNNCLSFVLGWLILEIVLCFSSEIETTCVRFNINHSIGKRLPVFPLKSLDGMGPGACYMKCQRVRDCLSVNYNRNHFICELLGQKKSNVTPLISDEDSIHIDLPDTVSQHRYVILWTVCIYRYCKEIQRGWFRSFVYIRIL